MHCDLDAFFASVEVVLHPELRGKPLIVGGDPKTRGIVACPSYEARQLGIRTAMSLRQAYRIAPHAIFLQGNFTHYREFSERFFHILADYTDRLEPLSLDEAYMDLTGIASWNTIERMIQEIRDRVKKTLGLSVSIGIGTSKTIAKIASDAEKPNGLVMVQPGMEPDFLAPRPIEEMPGIGKRTRWTFRRNGILTIGDLARLSDQRTIQLFGWRGTILQNRARGIDDRSIQSTFDPLQSIGHARTFERDITNRQIMLGTLSYLLEKAASRLRRHSAFATVVKVTIRYHDFRTESKQLRLRNPSDTQLLFYQKALQLFTELYRGQPVRLIGVTLTGLLPNPHQEAFAFSHLLRIRKIQRSVDTLRDRFGFHAVFSGSTLPLRRELLLHQR